jgi:hypothetical protein
LTGRLAKRSPSLDDARKALLAVPFMVSAVSDGVDDGVEGDSTVSTETQY